MILVVMGVSGSGKTTVGVKLAAALHCAFLEGDELHPQANIDKMSHGIPLTDADRAPWLAAIHAHMLDAFHAGRSLVVACSALEADYRTLLGSAVPVTWVYLKGSPALIRSRIEHRKGHFMKADMLASQFAALEEPTDAIVVDVAMAPEAIVQQVLAALGEPHTREAESARAADRRGEA
jgi:gluconokinase